jgi:transcriptional repressor NrdR
MRCPSCHSPENKVIDSRHLALENSTRRRRVCLVCSERYTTHEYPVQIEESTAEELSDRELLQLLNKRTLVMQRMLSDLLEYARKAGGAKDST